MDRPNSRRGTPSLFGVCICALLASEQDPFISTPGVLRLLGDGEGDMVSCEELDKIRDGLASGLLLRPHQSVSIGTRVRVRDGVFAGAEGVVAEFRQRCKIIISLAAVRQCFSLEVALDDLEVLNNPALKAGLRLAPAYSYSLSRNIA